MFIEILFFLIFIILFLLMAFFVKTKFQIYIIILNIIFISSTYIMISDLVGSDKPLNNSIPLYNHTWNKDKKIPLLFAYVNEKENKIYLLLKEKEIKFYSIPYNQDFVDELKQALTQTNGKYDGISIGEGVYSSGMGSSIGGGSHVMMASPQKDLSPPKLESNQDGNMTDFGSH